MLRSGVALRTILSFIIIVALLTACGTESSSDKDKVKQGEQKVQSILGGGGQGKKGKGEGEGSKEPSSVIDQELKKQLQIFMEIKQYQQEQDEKVMKQTEERKKKLEKEAEKKSGKQAKEGKE
jgi:hypothetical protein